MVGICGAIGGRSVLPDEFVNAVTWEDGEVTDSFGDDRVGIATSFHSLLAGDQPARAREGDSLVWVWGDVYGYGTGDTHVSRSGPTDGSAQYCADLYDSYGIDFVRELNGDFGIVIYDRSDDTISLVTDRVATRPFYHVRPTNDEFVFSSQVQALPRYPGVEPALDRRYLYEYFQLRRVFGVKTPLANVQEIPPASIATVDLEDASLSVDTYWRPRYRPVDEPFTTYLDRFVETFQEVIADWTRDDLKYGVLLSGGSDSRLVQAAMDEPVTAFHIADWMSREASVAREVAETAGDEFHLLERDEGYDARALERNPQFSNFSGWFDQAYFTGFADEIADEVDVLVSGLYADMLFSGGPLEMRSLSLGALGNLSVPVRKPVKTVEQYVRMQTADAVEPISYFTDDLAIEDVLTAEIRKEQNAVVSHGVRYESFGDLVMYGDFYPMGADTDANFSRSLMHMQPYRTPFLDNRLLDLQQRIPSRYLLRRNLVNRAVKRIEPSLADIPHARTGVPLKHEFPLDYVGENLHGFWRKHVDEETPPADHLDHGPWPDRRALLRTQNFPVETIVRNEHLLRELPFLSYDGALESYRSHVAGSDESTILYSLLTFLQTPLADQVCAGPREPVERPDALTNKP